jgi:hypothetical protein
LAGPNEYRRGGNPSTAIFFVGEFQPAAKTSFAAFLRPFADRQAWKKHLSRQNVTKAFNDFFIVSVRRILQIRQALHGQKKTG